jgi:hypothetical protein
MRMNECDEEAEFKCGLRWTVISCGDGGQTDNWIGSEDEEESRSRVTGSATVSIPDSAESEL